MNEYILAPEQIVNYGKYLQNEERSRGTIEKYLRDVKNFANWLDGKPVTMEAVTLWKEHLLAAQYSPATINSMLAALNGFFRFSGWESLRIRFLKIQRRIFREQRRELTRAEYLKLVETACSHRRERLALLIETICSTGIRVSEVQYITVQAARLGRTDISLKGKIRTILLPKISASWDISRLDL